MPDRSYVVSSAESGMPNLDIFVLDTTPMVGDYGEAAMRLMRGRIQVPRPGPQMAWLQRSLQRSHADWKIVVGHHPLYSGGRHGGSVELARRLDPMFATHGVQAYLCGHDHALQHIQVGGVAHICAGSGASAGPARDIEGTRFRLSRPGFAVFAMEERALRLEFRDFTGRSVYRTAIPKAGA